MSFISSKKKIIFGITFMLLAVVMMNGLKTMPIVNAEKIEDLASYNFTMITDENGVESYQVAIKATAKPTLEVAIIPETYNGLPVTAIANNGFMSCEKLVKVVLPKTIKKIGNNAFMNCQKLERLGLPAVESIGTNAFALCMKLDRMFIPKSVKSVGANILRNNVNTIYIQSSQEEIDSQWQSTWSSYYTGKIVTSANPEDVLKFREIKDINNEKTIGYEIIEDQSLILMGENLTIYNSYKTDENGEYLPLLNVCSEAFWGSYIDSITFKDRNKEDETAPKIDTPINIRSNAFIGSFVDEINFEIDITFNHPQNLQGKEISGFDEKIICGDNEGHSIRVFESSSIKSITLPQTIEFIPEKMFYNASYLNAIKIFNKEYTGKNELSTIHSIGNKAFGSCASLANLYITPTVIKMGEAVFENWGENSDLLQSLYIDYYEDEIPVTWSSNWKDGINSCTTIEYKKPVIIQIDLQDGTGNTMSIEVKPGLKMPEFEKPIRKGYQFKGIYSGVNGTGYQYYTNDLQVSRIWNEGDSSILYVCWEIEFYKISYENELGIPNPNPTTYTIEDEINFIELQREGYKCEFIPNKITKGTTGNLNIKITWSELRYRIKYNVDLKGCINNNPESYSITQNIVFENLQHEGYDFVWSPSSIPAGSIGEIEVTGIWTPKEYTITYVVYKGTINNNPVTYNYDEEVILKPATLGGYFVEWDRDSIPLHSTGDITIKAIYTEKTLDQCYNNGIYEIWTWNQALDLHSQPNGGEGRTYKLMKNIIPERFYGSYDEWTPIPIFNGTIDGNGHHISQFRLNTSNGGNIGFVGINKGIIKNLELGTYYFVEDTFFNVNVGSFAGINNGKILDCQIRKSFNSPVFRCYAKGSSYAGGFVGINNNIIENCSGITILQGNCDMGGVAGKNTKTIKGCRIEYADIDINYYNDYNSAVGGIVGVQSSGSVTNCYFSGLLSFYNYKSSKYPSILSNPELQPMVGTIIGRRLGGTSSGNNWESDNGRDSCIYTGSLSVITYNGKEFNQKLYFRNEECGRIG